MLRFPREYGSIELTSIIKRHAAFVFFCSWMAAIWIVATGTDYTTSREPNNINVDWEACLKHAQETLPEGVPLSKACTGF